MIEPDDGDTILADADEDESVALTAEHTTDGSTPGENQEVGIGVGEDD